MIQTRTIAACLVSGLALLAAPHLSGHRTAPTASLVPETTVETLVLDTASPDTASPDTQAPTTQPAPPSTSRGSLVTTTTGRAVDRLEVDQPLTQYLPHETRGWAVDYHMEGPRLVLTITVLSVVNRADQAGERKAQMAANKADALAWLAARGAKPGSYGILWRPSEAAGL
jgi:hypothetical protein